MQVESIPNEALKTGAMCVTNSPDQNSPPVWKSCLLAVVVISSFLLGSGRDTWSLGVVCCLMGGAVILCPPTHRLPHWASFSILVFAFIPLVGLLPSAWFGLQAPWRVVLRESWTIFLPGTVSPDPRATFESWLVVVCGMIWLWDCLSRRHSESGRRWCIYILATGGVIVAAASWVDYYMITIPWWPRLGVAEGNGFGPFANRNHTSSLNAIACILCAASAYDAYRRRSILGWFFAVAFWIPLTTILVNTSRGGILLLFLGLVTWVTTAAMKQGFVRKAAVGSAVLLVAASLVFVSGSRLSDRLRSLMLEDKVSAMNSSLRLNLARETLNSVAQHPWIGHGFDAFGSIFPMMTSMKVSDVRFAHPESDVLLLLFEGGLLALLPCVVFLIGFSRFMVAWTRSTGKDCSPDRASRRLMQAAAICAGMALLHSIFDVPNHVVGYGMHTALLLGLAIQPRRLNEKCGSLQRGLFRFSGLGIMALGVMWIGIGFKVWTPNVSSSVPVLREQAVNQSKQGRYREALIIIDRAIWLSPLDYRLYYQRAQLLLRLRQRHERALLDFGRSRALEPNFANICYEEGKYWLSFRPELAIIPWRDCLRRHPEGSDSLHGAYRSMSEMASIYPELGPPLWSMATSSHMQLLFLGAMTSQSVWREYLAKFLHDHPNLDELEPQHQRALMIDWYGKGDRVELMKLLEGNPRMVPHGWWLLARMKASAGEYEQAVRLAIRFIKRPSRPTLVDSSDSVRLERAFLFNPSDVRPGVELFHVQRASGDLKAAEITAKKVNALPDCPPYMRLELAIIYVELRDFRRAWEMVEMAMEGMADG